MFQFSISIILPGYQSGSLPIRTFEIPQTLALALSVVKIFFGVWLAVKGLYYNGSNFLSVETDQGQGLLSFELDNILSYIGFE